MATKVTPLGDNVLIEPLKQEQQTASGIFLPDTADKEKKQEGRVVAVGNGKDVNVKKGQTVLYERYGGEEITHDDTEYVIIKAEKILAVIE